MFNTFVNKLACRLSTRVFGIALIDPSSPRAKKALTVRCNFFWHDEQKMQHVGKQDVHLFFNEKAGPVHRIEATDYRERFSFANYNLDGFDNAAIAVLVIKRSNSGMGKIVPSYLRSLLIPSFVRTSKVRAEEVPSKVRK